MKIYRSSLYGDNVSILLFLYYEILFQRSFFSKCLDGSDYILPLNICLTLELQIFTSRGCLTIFENSRVCYPKFVNVLVVFEVL